MACKRLDFGRLQSHGLTGRIGEGGLQRHCTRRKEARAGLTLGELHIALTLRVHSHLIIREIIAERIGILHTQHGVGQLGGHLYR